jgi:hypothetical protein
LRDAEDEVVRVQKHQVKLQEQMQALPFDLFNAADAVSALNQELQSYELK